MNVKGQFIRSHFLFEEKTAHHFVTKSWKSLVKTPSGSLGGGWWETVRSEPEKKKSPYLCPPRYYGSVYRAVSHLVHNVVQQFKDGHGRSVHSMSWGADWSICILLYWTPVDLMILFQESKHRIDNFRRLHILPLMGRPGGLGLWTLAWWGSPSAPSMTALPKMPSSSLASGGGMG